MTDGITLKIDADTARFIAKIAQAAEGSKHLKDHVHGVGEAFHHLGEFAKEAVQIIAGMAVPLSLGGAGFAVLEQGAEAFKEHLREARDLLKETQDLYSGFARIGLGQEAPRITKAMKESAGNLSDPELAGIVGAVTAPGARPDASESEFARAAGVAGRAKSAGMNPSSFVGLWERLDAAGVPDAEDLAYYQQKYIGENAKFTGAAIKNPEQAGDIARYFAGAAAAGDRQTMSMMGKLVEAWTSRGAHGSFGDFLKSGLAVRAAGGREHMNTLRYIQSHQGPEIGHGMLNAAVESANANPVLESKNLVDEITEEAKEDIAGSTDLFGRDARQAQEYEARKKYADAKSATGAVGRIVGAALGNEDDANRTDYLNYGSGWNPKEFNKVIADDRRRAQQYASAQREALMRANPTTFMAGGSMVGYESGVYNNELRRILLEQLQVMQRSRLKPGAQGEHAP